MRRLQIVRKLDESKVEWILQEKRKCTPNKVIAQAMDVSVRWVQVLYSRYRDDTKISYPYPMGRPEGTARTQRAFGRTLPGQPNG